MKLGLSMSWAPFTAESKFGPWAQDAALDASDPGGLNVPILLTLDIGNDKGVTISALGLTKMMLTVKNGNLGRR